MTISNYNPDSEQGSPHPQTAQERAGVGALSDAVDGPSSAREVATRVNDKYAELCIRVVECDGELAALKAENDRLMAVNDALQKKFDTIAERYMAKCESARNLAYVLQVTRDKFFAAGGSI